MDSGIPPPHIHEMLNIASSKNSLVSSQGDFKFLGETRSVQQNIQRLCGDKTRSALSLTLRQISARAHQEQIKHADDWQMNIQTNILAR